jgi:hypothetical protein
MCDAVSKYILGNLFGSQNRDGNVIGEDQGVEGTAAFGNSPVHEVHIAQLTNRMNFDTDIDLFTKPKGVVGCRYLNYP